MAHGEGVVGRIRDFAIGAGRWWPGCDISLIQISINNRSEPICALPPDKGLSHFLLLYLPESNHPFWVSRIYADRARLADVEFISSYLTLCNIEDMARDVLANLITADRFLGRSTMREIMSRDRRFRLRDSRAKTMLNFRIGQGFDESDVICVQEALVAGDYGTILLNRQSIFSQVFDGTYKFVPSCLMDLDRVASPLSPTQLVNGLTSSIKCVIGASCRLSSWTTVGSGYFLNISDKCRQEFLWFSRWHTVATLGSSALWIAITDKNT
jgi:hypothetical protein